MRDDGGAWQAREMFCQLCGAYMRPPRQMRFCSLACVRKHSRARKGRPPLDAIAVLQHRENLADPEYMDHAAEVIADKLLGVLLVDL